MIKNTHVHKISKTIDSFSLKKKVTQEECIGGDDCYKHEKNT